jgi:antitoxin component HigA of HigAB toxin-antitoxin module
MEQDEVNMEQSNILTKLKLKKFEPTSVPEEVFSQILYNTPYSINNVKDNDKSLKIYKFIRSEYLCEIKDRNLKKKVEDFVKALGSRIAKFENEYYPYEKSAPLEILLSFVDDHRLDPKDLKDEIGSLSNVHKVLRGEREISLKVAKKLGERFCVRPTLFLDL